METTPTVTRAPGRGAGLRRLALSTLVCLLATTGARAAAAAPPTAAAGRELLVELLPAALVEITVLELRLWQWLGILVLVVVAYLLAWMATLVIARAVHTLVVRARITFDEEILRAVTGPLRLLIAVAVFSSALYTLGLPRGFHRTIAGVEKVAAIVALTWVLLRLVDVFAHIVEQRFVERAQRSALSIVPLGRRTLRAFVFVIAAVAVLQNLGFHVTGIIAGLGVGGLAVALAAQRTIEHLFGGLSLITDQPVRVGDFCRFGDSLGTIEDIGLRSTRVRTLDRTVITIPNADFAALAIENFALRDRIRLFTTIGLRYETTPDQLRHVLVELKRMLLAHPKVLPDPARVRFAGFGAYSLDLEFFVYIATADVNEFHAIREDIFLRIMDVVAASGTGFAFPSQTLYVGTDGGLDAERGRAAEAQVRAWREAQALCLPDVPPEQAAALAGSLDYPPAGSATRG
jgi:MscS family membrane protein